MKERTIMPNGRYTDDELNLLKNVFAENLPLIKILRKAMLQLEMIEKEDVQCRMTFRNSTPLTDLMRKMFLPTIDGDAPIDQIVDLWLTVKIDDKMPEEAKSILEARELTIDYINMQLLALEGNEMTGKQLKDFDVKDPTMLRARNTIIMHVENQLREINGLAGFKAETPEETLKRLKQNSTK